MTFLILATVILLGVDGAAPDYTVSLGTTHGVVVSSEGHPSVINVESITPGGQIVQVMNCIDSTTCAASVTFPQCGLYQFPGVVEYAFMDEGDIAPYIFGVNAAVVVVGCGLFADGFENGTTDAWSKTEGG